MIACSSMADICLRATIMARGQRLRAIHNGCPKVRPYHYKQPFTYLLIGSYILLNLDSWALNDLTPSTKHPPERTL